MQEAGLKVGKALASHGAMERFAMDFVTVRRADGGWDCHAIEINLRWGGTTHPSATLRLLTHGHLDEKTGVYRSDRGTAKFYYATDNLKDPRLQGLTPADLALISSENGLDFDHETQKGVIFHLMGTLSMFGKVGATCIADSTEEAREMYKRASEVVLAAQAAASR